ncbi:MAG: hypothetical protein VKI81_11745, partial [Synechococcaceae cyanobacterium]|nr:hypothetical protein [Synechococcaceae cyanobacterium]
MAGGAQKWLVGCGIGCGILILAAGGIGTCSYVGIKKIKDRAEQLDAGFDALYAEYGRPAEFTPPADGVVPAGRLETFLAVRAAMAPSREELADVLTELDADTEGVGGVFRKIGAGMSILPRMFDFIDERNLALADHRMGVGEYLYIYSLAYYSWLGKDPADGPSFAVSDHEEDRDRDGVTFTWKGDGRSSDDPEEVREQRERQIRRYLNRIQRQMLANQRDAARGRGLDEAWISRLEAEEAALDASAQRLMWQDGLPESAAASLAPFRERLEAAYTPVM